MVVQAALRRRRGHPRRPLQSKGVSPLYLSLSIETAIKEANQGFAFKIEPCVLCSYDVDCMDIADLRTDAGRDRHKVIFLDMACGWFFTIADGKEPPPGTLLDA